MKTVGVEFKKNGKQYIFFDNNLELEIGMNVIVDTERGLQFGKIASINNKDDKKDHMNVVKIASSKDIKQNELNIEDAKEALQKAETLVNKLNLDMKLIDSYYTFDRKQLVFQFLADNRIDFRELAKQLASIYKTRIELRQVGVRDKAKEISGIGQCGRKLCCSTFLNDLDSVGIAQVKNQNLALNPSKINGLCGRLLCCLKYEDDLYSKYRKDLPEVGDKITYNGNECTVISLDIPRRKYVLLSEDNEKYEVEVPYEENKRRKNNK
ncbi:MAG: stage 0 sporulation protein [Bacilli bacterium]|nr:stage 0 sporulation protein [Bacilli bacterium]